LTKFNNPVYTNLKNGKQQPMLHINIGMIGLKINEQGELK